MPCKRACKIQGDDQYLAWWGLNFLPLDVTSYLLGQCANTAEASCILTPLLASQAPPYNKALDSLQVAYTGYKTGAYMAPALIEFQFFTLVEGLTLFVPELWRLQTLDTGAYAWGYTSTLGPLGLITREIWN